MNKDNLQYQFQPGDRVNWMMTPPGGYGYTQTIAGIVITVTAKRVRIKVARRQGNEWIKELKWVKTNKLTLRQSVCSHLDLE